MERDYLSELRGTTDYQLGYAKSAIRTAIWFLERNSCNIESVLQGLKNTASILNISLVKDDNP